MCASRRYDSPRRREQVAATRLSILEAAQRLFEEQGYTAAPADPELDALWRRIQAEVYDNQHSIVELLHQKHALRPGLDVARGTDILWTLNHPNVYRLLVGERGWTPGQYEEWLGDALCSQFLPS